MGQKTNPIGNRLGIIRGWESMWYGGNDYGDKLAEDDKIRKYIYVRLAKASVSRVIIERTLKIDGALVKSLGDNIKNLNATAASMDGSAGATNRYNDEMAKATAQMESINNLYKAQLDSAAKQAEINAESIENATKLKEQMESLASNLSSLNGVYGGMLSAMNKKS